MKKINKEIEQWFKSKNITNYDKQELKFYEEFGELCAAFLKGKEFDLVDAIGDTYITIVGLETINPNGFTTLKNVMTIDGIRDLPFLVKNRVYNDAYELLEQFAKSQGYELEYCVNVAWNVVKKRTGKTIDGCFIKD